TWKTSSYCPGLYSSPASKGASVRPSLLVVTVFSSLRCPPSSAYSAISMPSAGLPCIVSSTWVLRRPIASLLHVRQGFEAQAGNLPNLAQRGGEFLLPVISQPACVFRSEEHTSELQSRENPV